MNPGPAWSKPPLTAVFKELDFQQTALGEISLRLRSEPRLNDRLIYEVKLNDEFLMSSLFTEGEVALATLALESIEIDDMNVVVGGLGLGHTAAAALEHESVASLTVIEVMPVVIEWHRRALVPLGKVLSDNSRCRLVEGDFFAIANDASAPFDPNAPDTPVHAILLDIDHAPDHWLNPDNQIFYTASGLQRIKNKLHSGGVFGLWSNDPADTEFTSLLENVFGSAQSHMVTFDNPYSGAQSSNTIYLAHKQ